MLTWIIVCLLLFVTSFSGTYAYFTATATEQTASVETGRVNIGFTAGAVAGQTITTTSSFTTKVLPGDTKTITAVIKNTGNVQEYVVAELQVIINSNLVDKKFYTATGSSLAVANGEFATGATLLNASASTSFSADYVVSGGYDDTYKNLPIEFKLIAHAIQHEHIPGNNATQQAINATNLMLDASCLVPVSEYQTVTYLESTGIQWIDTGVENCADWDMVLDMAWVSTNHGSGQYGGGYASNGIDNNSQIACTSNRNWTINGSNASTDQFELNKRYVAKCSQTTKSLYVDDVYKTNRPSLSLNNWHIFIFATNNGGKAGYTSFEKVYNAKIYVNGTMMRNLVPSVRLSDDKPGMYDTVTGNFYTNAGTGEFKYSRLPDAYQEVEYIESSGTQYINTGFLTETTYKVKIRFSPQNTSVIQDIGVTGNTPNWFEVQEGAVFSFANTKVANINVGSIYNIDYYFQAVDPKANIKVSDDNGNELGSLTDSKGPTTNKLFYLWAYTPNTTTASTGIMKIYSCQIYNSKALMVRNFVPCVRISDNVAGMFDLVTNTFYTNAGSGTFTVGPNV